MRIPKRYGTSKKQDCPFCGRPAVTVNSQKIPVCINHKSDRLDLKCVCGEYLDVRNGKFGAYFHCMNCGNINFNKGLEMNSGGSGYKVQSKNKTTHTESKPVRDSNEKKTENNKRKEVTITSDDIGVTY